ncbi:nucleotide exchange factor GrpE [Pulveribacter sp.]|uniref:nucleotide exchange factor GrpE n=1 Tax=Pulveribacter sp. TaxID=2678893 RepID=UPI00391751F9
MGGPALEIHAAAPKCRASPFFFRHFQEQRTDMSDQPQSASSPEEVEAAMAANAADELSRLQAELAELKAKSADLADQYLRAKAEAENARRRADDEVAKARKFGIESFAESLLPVCDSLDAALAIDNATAEQLREGSDATLRQLLSALERNKVVVVNPEPGAKFDPHQHQAISVVPAAQEPNTVVGVLQKGYLISDRVLRPALVTVAAPQ